MTTTSDTQAQDRPPDTGPARSLPDPLQWWLERRRRRRLDPNPLAKGEPYRHPPWWQRVLSLLCLLLIALALGLVLTAAIMVVVAALALALQSSISS